ncbi:hypothetical protein UACE39S_01363 [Ureibacillus acetophenoni]
MIMDKPVKNGEKLSIIGAVYQNRTRERLVLFSYF